MLDISQHLDSFLQTRFKDKRESGPIPEIDQEFYSDLLSVFHSPESFDPILFQKYSLHTILIYLRKTHVFYLQKYLKEIELSINNLDRNNERLGIWKKFLGEFHFSFSKELTDHIDDEEEKLFPYLDALLGAQNSQKLVFGVNQKMELMHFLIHHDDELENKLITITKAIEKKASQMDDVFALRMLLAKYKTFETDLRIHSQIEEQVLMPLAITLEEKVLGDKKLSVEN